jgi:hypothetical protein
VTNKLLVFVTNVTIKLFLVRRWGRPPLPDLDTAKDALIFQQLELDHYIGELHLCTFHIAVDFLIVPYKGLYGWGGGGERVRKVTLRNC